LRNGWFLPKRKSSICTEQYLKDVLMEKIWCIKYKDVKLLPCPRPPSKQLLIEKFQAMATANKWVTCVTEDHVPDKRWLLDVLSTFAPQDEIFGKGFYPAPKKNKLSEIKSVTLPESFLADLPISKKKLKRRGLRIVADGVSLQRIQRLKALQKEVANRIIIEESKKDERRKDKKDSSKSPKPAKVKPKGGAGKANGGDNTLMTD